VLLLLIASGLQAAALVLAVPLPHQRYAIPLLPFACLWSALGATHLLRLFFPGVPHSFDKSSLREKTNREGGKNAEVS
jgi:hypothetical protein